MKNTLGDLNNHLFAQLERLGDEDIKGDKLEEEIHRAKAVTSVATQIINTGKLAIEAQRLVNESPEKIKLPPMLEGDKIGS